MIFTTSSSTASYILTDRKIAEAFLTHPTTINLTHARFVAGGLKSDEQMDLLERGQPLNIRLTGILANEAIYQWLSSLNVGAELEVKIDEEVKTIRGFTMGEMFDTSTLSIEIRRM